MNNFGDNNIGDYSNIMDNLKTLQTKIEENKIKLEGEKQQILDLLKKIDIEKYTLCHITTKFHHWLLDRKSTHHN